VRLGSGSTAGLVAAALGAAAGVALLTPARRGGAPSARLALPASPATGGPAEPTGSTTAAPADPDTAPPRGDASRSDGGPPAHVAAVASAATPVTDGARASAGEDDVSALVAGLDPAAARARLEAALVACRDADRRRRLGRRLAVLRLSASPLDLAAAEPVDLHGIAAARGPSALPEQQELLLDPAWRGPVRRAAGRALAAVRTEQATRLLLEAVRRGDATARAAAADGLAGRGAAEEVLEDLLADPAPPVRAAAARALGARPAAVRALTDRLAVERDPGVRVACAGALRRLVAVGAPLPPGAARLLDEVTGDVDATTTGGRRARPDRPRRGARAPG